ncbi:programmed cell death 1 [Phyllostomus discolor]|uniref:Programmed cell death 1 n=1 Tax=Phyllostomus discolor TaxID=89673 RepID=A0A6J2LH48_9CHIR|nr:programmed cell death protein 1 isoform X1 [Phyllostomus discolor]KAF6115413.1 programmed cell death 1 [Phyllostomus discolor]
MGTPWTPWPLLWSVLQLSWRSGWLLETPDRPWNPLTFSPPQLTVAEGETATFTCSFSNTSKHFVLNWYRVSPSNQTVKLAAFPKDSSQVQQDPRFQVTWLPNGRDFEMSVLAAQRNDSGTYFCGVIYLPPEMQIYESPHAELTVTERTLEPPTETPSPPARPAGQLQGLVIGVTGVLVGILLLLLLAWVLITTFPRATGGPCACCREDPPLKDGVSPGPVFSVDYEELDFQWQEKTPETFAPSVPQETEYATIVFPGRPGSPARRASADSPQGPWPPRLEDGRCSWPL